MNASSMTTTHGVQFVRRAGSGDRSHAAQLGHFLNESQHLPKKIKKGYPWVKRQEVTMLIIHDHPESSLKSRHANCRTMCC